MSSKVKGYLASISGASFWGVSGICSQYFFENYEVSSAQVTVIRMIFTALILLPILRVQKGKEIYAIFNNRHDTFILVVFSIFGLLFCQYAYIAAIYHSNAPTATVIQYLGPILILIYLCFKRKSLPNLQESISMALAIGGVFLLVTHGNIDSLAISPEGIFWGFNAALGLALYMLIPVRLISRYGVLTVIGYAMGIGGVALMVFNRVDIFSLHIDLAGYVAALIIVVVGTLGGFGLYLYGSSLVGAMDASMLGSFEPLTSLVLSVLIFDLDFIALDYLGFAMVLATIFILAYKPEKKVS